MYKARLTFAKWRQAFIIVPILEYFDQKCHIWIEINASSYVIDQLLNQLISNNLSQLHLVAIFF